MGGGPAGACGLLKGIAAHLVVLQFALYLLIVLCLRAVVGMERQWRQRTVTIGQIGPALWCTKSRIGVSAKSLIHCDLYVRNQINIENGDLSRDLPTEVNGRIIAEYRSDKPGSSSAGRALWAEIAN